MTAVPLSLVDLGKIFTGMAEALGKLGDSVAHLVKLGAGGWDATQARALRGRLIEMSASLRNVQSLNAGAFTSLEMFEDYLKEVEHYLSGPAPRKEEIELLMDRAWKITAERLAKALSEGAKVIEGLKAERSEFVLTEAYNDLTDILVSRELLLRRLVSLEQPRTKADLEPLGELLESYRLMRTALRACIDKLGDYALADGKE